jgi:hypothetical protein
MHFIKLDLESRSRVKVLKCELQYKLHPEMKVGSKNILPSDTGSGHYPGCKVPNGHPMFHS